MFAVLFELVRRRVELDISSIDSDPSGSRPEVFADAGAVGGDCGCVFFGIFGMSVS